MAVGHRAKRWTPTAKRARKARFYRARVEDYRGWTYIVEAEGTGYVKIGQTKDLGQRLDALQIASPYPLQLLRKIQGTGHERVLFKNLSQFRERGEWFRKTPELVAYLNRYWRSDADFRPIA